MQRDVLSPGIFTSIAALARKLRSYIKAYAKPAKPFRWKYSDPTRRIPHGQLIPGQSTSSKTKRPVTFYTYAAALALSDADGTHSVSHGSAMVQRFKSIQYRAHCRYLTSLARTL